MTPAAPPTPAAHLDAQQIPIDTLKPFKPNPRRGDVEQIRASLRKRGQYKPIVVRKRTREILAGNHTWLAAKAEGWEEIWAVFVDVDAKTAKEIVALDNRIPDLGEYDNEDLLALLGDIDLDATGYDKADLERLQKQFDEGDQPIEEELPARFGVVVELGDEGEQAKVMEAIVEMGFEPRALYA